jgi:Kef-type K+ transport system membrane component KefB
MENLIIVGWVITTLLYIATHHLYNWSCRLLAKEKNEEIILVATILYIFINIGYFVFTHSVFNII